MADDPRRARNEALIDAVLSMATDDCIEWSGPRDENGYGRIRVHGKHQRVHRIVLERATRAPVDGEFALHSCDNPPCVNPRHLRWGSNADNMQDASERDRFAGRPRGEQHHQAKLTRQQVLQIKIDVGTQRDIARRFGVHQSTVGAIKTNRYWR